MRKRTLELACRRRQLLEKIGRQRMDATEIASHLKKPLAMADAGLAAVRFLHRHFALATIAISALMILRRDGFAGLTREGWRLSSILMHKRMRRITPP